MIINIRKSSVGVFLEQQIEIKYACFEFNKNIKRNNIYNKKNCLVIDVRKTNKSKKQ